MDRRNKIRKKIYETKRRIREKLNRPCNMAHIRGRRTSISDSDQYGYTLFCEMASKSDKVFNNFRHNRAYREIVEDVGYDIGEGCWNIIRAKKISDKVLNECWKNDLVGGAETYYYDGLTKPVAPATMRYVKIMLEIMELFGKVDNVVEIGVGYGGQCRLISKFCSVDSYCLVDIPQALGVSRKYLSRFFSERKMAKYRFVDGTSLNEIIDSGLVISNYAFSELCREVQNTYLNDIIKHAEKGYITWNELSHTRLDGYSLEEICEMIPGSRIIDEVPLSAEGNKVIVWGTR